MALVISISIILAVIIAGICTENSSYLKSSLRYIDHQITELIELNRELENHIERKAEEERIKNLSPDEKKTMQQKPENPVEVIRKVNKFTSKFFDKIEYALNVHTDEKDRIELNFKHLLKPYYEDKLELESFEKDVYDHIVNDLGYTSIESIRKEATDLANHKEINAAISNTLIFSSLGKKYHIFTNLFVNHHSIDYVEIDQIIVCNKGILVHEVKDYAGIVSGDAGDTRWNCYGNLSEQTDIYNPILQNLNHINYLCEYLKEISKTNEAIKNIGEEYDYFDLCFNAVNFFGNGKLSVSKYSSPSFDYALINSEVNSKSIQISKSKFEYLNNLPDILTDEQVEAISEVLKPLAKSGKDREEFSRKKAMVEKFNEVDKSTCYSLATIDVHGLVVIEFVGKSKSVVFYVNDEDMTSRSFAPNKYNFYTDKDGIKYWFNTKEEAVKFVRKLKYQNGN